MNTEELLTTAEAAKLLRVSRTTLYRLIRDGVITARGAGNTNLFVKSELMDALLSPKQKLAS